MAYAHSRNAQGLRHDLGEHLHAVAMLAASYAEAFGGGEFARMAGLLHDIGKASPAFQAYLAACEREPERRHRTVDHKGAGTLAALEHADELAFLIHGHHGGLPDKASLITRLKELRGQPELTDLLAQAARTGLLPQRRAPGDALFPEFAASELAVELFLRMAFSALVDADHLDTERHFSPEQTVARDGAPDLALLAERLRAAQQALSGQKSDPVNQVRDEVYRACLDAARLSPGFFRLTVPTGGGKTRSGLAFALEHALVHGLRRVVVAVPFLTITDQTATVYRDVLGDDRAVLEHHSEASARDDDAGSQEYDALWRHLATQTWDAAVVVTTTVQLFESLLGRSTRACRKLHRLARSVILLDEVQTLPPPLLDPILSVLRELVANYGASVVLCTATQPAFAKAPGFEELGDVREIVPDPARHFRTLKRVTYDWPALSEPEWDWQHVAAVMRAEPRALAIVNTKSHALALLDALRDPDAFHLSTLLCGAHRRDVLALIRGRLERGEPCRVVSTQVVEAGVDIDFPVVLRAMGPLDRIVQAAGRCNREGRLAQGRVVVFKPVGGGMPPGPYRAAGDLTEGLLRGGIPDMDDPALFERYFGSLFPLLSLDAKEIQPKRRRFSYEEVAAAFRMIDDDTLPVIVPYRGIATAEAAEAGLHAIDHARRYDDLLRELESAVARGSVGLARRLYERAQPYVVALRRRQAEGAQRQGLLTELPGGMWKWEGGYDAVRGLVAPRDPEEFVI